MRWSVACLAFAAASLAAYPIATAPVARQGTAYLLLHVVLTVCMLGAWLDRRTDPRWVLGTGVVVRLALLAVPPFTTHDVERYLWDGAVTLGGYDPYRLAPVAPALAGLRELWPTSAAHVELTTIYPPGALALFALAATTGVDAAPLMWKVLVTGAALATVLLAAALLRRRGLERHLPLVALSPLLVLETGVGAHLDAFSTLALVGALWGIEHDRPVAAGLALACGVLVKFLPVVVVLPLLAVLGRRRAGVLVGAVASATAAGYGVAMLVGLRPLGSLGTFFAHARFGSPLAMLLETVGGVGGLVLGAAAVAAGMLVCAVVVAARGRRGAALQWALAAPLVVSPVVYPWYLSPLVVCAAFAPSAVVVAWAATLPLTYEVLDELGRTGQWLPARWPLVVVALGWLGGAVFDTARMRRVP